MRLSYLLFGLLGLLGLLLWGMQVEAQGFSGLVKNDSPYILVNVPRFTGWETLSAQWGFSPERLQRANPEVGSSSAGIPVSVMVPIYYLLKSEPCDSCGPVYHTVGKSEGLYRIGKWYGNQPTAVLKARNRLRSDALQPGQQLLVGYLLPIQTIPVDTNSAIVMLAKPDSANSAVQATVLEETVIVPMPPPRKMLSYAGEGAFAAEYVTKQGTVVKKSGKASSFKSESGWADGRFYVLNSQLKTGVVVKVTNPLTGVFLYAKVVGPLPDIKQNHGLDLRLSNAAVTMLGLLEEEKSFDLLWEY